MIQIKIGNDVYNQCYSNKYVREGDPRPYFDLLHPLKMAPVPIYNYENMAMIKYMVPCQIKVENTAPDAEKEYLKIKDTDLDTWHYYKEKYKQWTMQDAERQLGISKMLSNVVIDTNPHKRLAIPFMQRFEVEK